MKVSSMILCCVLLIACHSKKSMISSEQFDIRRLQTMAVNLADTTFIVPGNIFRGIPSTSSLMGAYVPVIHHGSMDKTSCPGSLQPAMIVRHTLLTGECRDNAHGSKQGRHQVDKTQEPPDESLITFLIIIVVILVMRLVLFRLNRC